MQGAFGIDFLRRVIGGAVKDKGGFLKDVTAESVSGASSPVYGGQVIDHRGPELQGVVAAVLQGG